MNSLQIWLSLKQILLSAYYKMHNGKKQRKTEHISVNNKQSTMKKM